MEQITEGYYWVRIKGYLTCAGKTWNGWIVGYYCKQDDEEFPWFWPGSCGGRYSWGKVAEVGERIERQV